MEKRAFEVNEEDLQKEAFVVSEDDVDQKIVVVDDEEKAQPIEVGAWADAASFVKYCVAATRMDAAPAIKADNNSSLIRAIAYFENVEKEIADGAAADADHGDLTIEQLEVLDKVTERAAVAKEQLKKTAERTGMLKQASKAARFVYVVDPFLFAVARLVVNAKVANGKNIEDTYTKMASKYSLDERERLAITQIIRDMGYPIHGSFVADEGSFDMITQYFA